MASVMPGTVIRLGAEYNRRPVLSLFGERPKKQGREGLLTVAGTQIKLQASISITRQFDFADETVISGNDEEPQEMRGLFVDIVA